MIDREFGLVKLKLEGWNFGRFGESLDSVEERSGCLNIV